MTDSKHELFLMLFEDRDILGGVLKNARPSTAMIRSTIGPILRRWYIQENFKSVEKLFRTNPIKIEYMSDDVASKLANKGELPHWVGNFSYGEASLAFHAGTPENVARKLKGGGGPRLVSRSRQEYLKQPVCRIQGKTFTRREVINFHANKLGGAHFDPKAIENDSRNARLREALGFEVNESANTVQIRLGPEIQKAKLDPARRAGIYELADIIVLDAATSFEKCVTENECKILRLLEQEGKVTGNT